MTISEESTSEVKPILTWPQLLEDTPADDDHLESFGRMEEALFNIIRENQGGKTVCIRGAWGTGKSTLVKMLANRFVSSKSNSGEKSGSPRIGNSGNNRAAGRPDVDGCVFLYDAWVHAGDPLRRAFLSSLVDFLLARGWLSDNKPAKRKRGLLGVLDIAKWLSDDMRPASTEGEWTVFKHKLAGRYKTVERVSSYRFGPLSRLISGTVVAVPVMSLAWYRVSSSLQETLASSDSLSFVVGCLFIAIAVLGAALCLPDRLISALTKRDSFTEKVDTTDEPVPSSIEFEERFLEILDRAFADENRRLVIVLDNLDRISKQERDSVWTLLRSFIDNSNIAKSRWFKNIWVLVPFAESTPPQLNVDREDDRQKTERNVKEAAASPTAGIASDAFSEKLFQITLDMPPPTLYRWEKYLTETLNHAFGGGVERFQTIARLFGATSKTQAAPTMRGIVKFVNSLVALHYQWPDISISNLAAFELAGGREGVGKGLDNFERWDELARIVRHDSDLTAQIKGGLPEDVPNGGSLTEIFTRLYYGVKSVESKVSFQLELCWADSLKGNDKSEALSLMRNDSAVSALNKALEGLHTWIETPVNVLNSFVLLAWLYDLRIGSDISFSRLIAPANWALVAQAVRDVMRRTELAPVNEANAVEGYKAYLAICENSADAARDAFASLRRLGRTDAPQTDFQSESAWRLANILTLPQFDELVRVEPEPLVLPCTGKDYLRFCGMAREVILGSYARSALDNFETFGFGRWVPRSGWLPMDFDFEPALQSRRIALSFPLAFRCTPLEELKLLFDWFIYAATQTNAKKPTGAKIGFFYFSKEIGAVITRKILRRKNNLIQIFEALELTQLNNRHHLHIQFFILLILAVGTSTEIRAKPKTSSGEKTYSKILTDESTACAYASAVRRITKYYIGANSIELRWREGDEPLAYWERVADSFNREFKNRFPGLRIPKKPLRKEPTPQIDIPTVLPVD